jgi:uncharacterized protein (TIGR02145 family)
LFSFSCKKDKPAPPLTVTDADGNVYQTVTIGTQTWTTENLKTTKYNDGTAIPYVADAAGWSGLAFPGYTWYGFDSNNKMTYGALYNWHAVNTGKLAPIGWHVPTEAEWQTLLTYLGGASVAGDKLKEAGNTHWTAPSSIGTNFSGFTALPGGFITYTGIFIDLTFTAIFWSATEVSAINASAHILNQSVGAVTPTTANKSSGYSIRLVKDY